MIIVEPDSKTHQGLLILHGRVGALQTSSLARRADTDGDFTLAVLDSESAVAGDREAVGQAVTRWRRNTAAEGSELAAKLKQLSETYDNWFLAVRPFEDQLEEGAAPRTPLKYRADFPHVVSEVRGGIRLGRTDEFQVEAEMSSAEDAAALAALSRWFPSFVQLRDPNATEGALAEIAENLTVTSSGRVASVSFTLDESKLEQLVKARTAVALEPPVDADTPH